MDRPPVFILSAPRSGTTWLVRALSAHPAIHASELRAFGDHVDVVRDHGWERPRLRIGANPSMPSKGLAPVSNELPVSYEQMSTNVGTELRRICEFIDVSATDDDIRASVDVSTFEKMSGGRQRGDDAPGAHVRKGVVGDWRRYFTATDALAFDSVAGRTLRAWGYAPDSTWPTTMPDRLTLRPSGNS